MSNNVWEKTLKAAREYKKKYDPEINPTEANKLSVRMMQVYKTKKEYFDVEKDVIDFLKSDASEEDKNLIRGQAEALVMVLNAIREGRVDLE